MSPATIAWAASDPAECSRLGLRGYAYCADIDGVRVWKNGQCVAAVCEGRALRTYPKPGQTLDEVARLLARRAAPILPGDRYRDRRPGYDGREIRILRVVEKPAKGGAGNVPSGPIAECRVWLHGHPTTKTTKVAVARLRAPYDYERLPRMTARERLDAAGPLDVTCDLPCKVCGDVYPGKHTDAGADHAYEMPDEGGTDGG